jgi:anti-anti-sigma factor
MLSHRFSRSDREEHGNFALRISRDTDSYVLEAFGALDADMAGLVESTLQHGEESSADRIVVDLSGVDFLATDVVMALVDAGARSRDNGRRLALLRAPDHVHGVLVRTGVAARLPFVD